MVDDQGESGEARRCRGYLVIKKPWPAMLRTIWRDRRRYVAGYWRNSTAPVRGGDSAHRDVDGYFWILGTHR